MKRKKGKPSSLSSSLRPHPLSLRSSLIFTLARPEAVALPLEPAAAEVLPLELVVAEALPAKRAEEVLDFEQVVLRGQIVLLYSSTFLLFPFVSSPLKVMGAVENRERCVRLARRSLMRTKDAREFIGNASLFQGK